MMDSYNNAVKERAEAEARYHRDAANYTPETSPESAPESNSEPVLNSDEYRDLPNFGIDGKFSVPSINPIFFWCYIKKWVDIMINEDLFFTVDDSFGNKVQCKILSLFSKNNQNYVIFSDGELKEFICLAKNR